MMQRNKSFLLIFLLSISLGIRAQWNTERITLIGRNALYFEDYVLSIQYFNQVIKIKPYLSEPFMYRAIAKIQLSDYEGAASDASESIDRNPFTPQAFYVRGFALMHLNKFEEAASDFSKALEFSPNNYPLLMSRIDALNRLKDYDGALKDIATYLKLSPATNTLYYEKGIILLNKKDTVGAELSFNKFIESDSTSALGWSARGLLRLQQKKYDDAYSDYSKAILNKSNYYGDYINRGIINVERKNYREALKDYDQSIKLEANNAMAYFNRGMLRANLGDDNNALTDILKVIKLDSTITEAKYNLALLNLKLRKYRDAIANYNDILHQYPYFIPAFWGMAEAYDKLGDVKESFRLRQKASEMEKNKDVFQQKIKKKLEAKSIIADATQASKAAKNASLFNQNMSEDVEENNKTTKYKDEIRGAVQNRFVDVVNEKNFVLTYYAKNEELRRTSLFHPLINDYNNKKVLNSALKITNKEIPLTSDLIENHFKAIDEISSEIETNSNNPDLYFHRSMEFALVQDFSSAIEDLNRAITLKPDFVLAYFTRANLRYKLIDFSRKNQQDKEIENNKNQAENQYKFEFESIMRDYDKVIDLQPDFSFAYYNKANILCTLKDFKSAISYYSQAVKNDPDFAEAYFNRGLTSLFIGNDTEGLKDLSKSGELGIYGAYNLIRRFSGKE